jgi:hypothetical protein
VNSAYVERAASAFFARTGRRRIHREKGRLSVLRSCATRRFRRSRARPS